MFEHFPYLIEIHIANQSHITPKVIFLQFERFYTLKAEEFKQKPQIQQSGTLCKNNFSINKRYCHYLSQRKVILKKTLF